jgi:hypothetical protein
MSTCSEICAVNVYVDVLSVLIVLSLSKYLNTARQKRLGLSAVKFN